MSLQELLQHRRLPQSLIVRAWTEESLDRAMREILRLEFQEDDHPDFLYLKPEGEYYRLQDLEGIEPFIQAYPQFHSMRVVYIHMAERLSTACANRLLKSLEEPPSSSHFILGTTAQRRMLATLRSRCLEISLGETSPLRTIQPELKHILLGIHADAKPKETWQKAIEIADGGDTLRLLSDLIYAYTSLLAEGRVDYVRSLHIGSHLREMWRACVRANSRLNPKLCIERVYMENNPFWNRTIL